MGVRPARVSGTTPTEKAARFGILDDLTVSCIEQQPGQHGPASLFNPAKLPAHPTAVGWGTAGVLSARNDRTDDPGRPAGLHPAYGDVTGTVPPGARGDPADPGGRHPLGTGTRRVWGGDADVRPRRRGRR